MNVRLWSLFAVCALGSAVGSMAACSTSTEEPGSTADASTKPDDASSGTDTSSPADATPVPDATSLPDASEPDAEPPPPPPPPPDLLTRETLQVGSRMRTYGVRLPKTYDPAVTYPVVMVFHGNGGDGESVYAFFKYQAASGDNAILVYPDAENLNWDLYTPAASNKDIAYMEALVPALAAKYSIDSTKVFGFGWSNGGFFINQVACRRSAFFRGVAAMAGGAPYEPSDPNRKWPNGFQKCLNQTAVPYIGFHGTNDPVVDFAGGEFAATYWGYVNGCAANRTATTPAPCEEHANCTSGKPVVFCPVPGIGHGIWGQAATASWDFFQTL
jgi:polyhydroxybutyrate depolymerase